MKHSKNSPDGIIDNMEFSAFSANMRILLPIGAVSPIWSVEAEKTTDETRLWKIAFRSTMTTDWQKNDLDLIQKEWNINNRFWQCYKHFH